MIRYLFGLILRLFKLSVIILIWPFLDHSAEQPPRSEAEAAAAQATTTSQAALIRKQEMLEALEVQQDTLREQIKQWSFESVRTNVSENKKAQLRCKVADGNVKLLKINEKIMKLREEIDNEV